MVQPGGKSTMLGHWRIVLRQAEEAAKAGRYDEALALASRPDVADHHHAVQLRGRLALDLIAPGGPPGRGRRPAGAIDDLDLAERLGAAPDTLAAARLKLADRVAGEVRGDLDAGEPGRVVERIDGLARHKIGGPSLRRTREVAEAWQAAIDEARRGEFGRAARPARPRRAARRRRRRRTPWPPPAATSRPARRRPRPKVEALYAALEKGQWAEVLAAAEAVLEHGPRTPRRPPGPDPGLAADRRDQPVGRRPCPAAASRVPQSSPRARWPPTASTGRDPFPTEAAPIVWLPPGPEGRRRPARPARWPAPAEPGPKGRFLLWVDAVGGYLVCLDDQVVLGRAGHDSTADVPLMGDLSRSHATLARDGDGYVLRAHQPTFVNGRPVETAPLRDGDVIRLGATVELEFRQPSPVSSTARLSVVSRHRLPLSVDGVLLMAETCIVGDTPQAHVPAPGLSRPGRPLPPGERPLVPRPRRVRGRRPDLRRPRPADPAIERPRRRLLLQPGGARDQGRLNQNPRGLVQLS